MTQNQSLAPFLTKGFLTVPSMRLGDVWSGRSQLNKQTKQNKQNIQPNLRYGCHITRNDVEDEVVIFNCFPIGKFMGKYIIIVCEFNDLIGFCIC